MRLYTGFTSYTTLQVAEGHPSSTERSLKLSSLFFLLSRCQLYLPLFAVYFLVYAGYFSWKIEPFTWFILFKEHVGLTSQNVLTFWPSLVEVAWQNSSCWIFVSFNRLYICLKYTHKKSRLHVNLREIWNTKIYLFVVWTPMCKSYKY